jgi:Tfp pilus assembly protein PilF
MQGAGLVVEIKQERGPGRGGMGGAMSGIDMEHLRELMTAQEKNPSDPKVLLELGNTFMMMQAWDKALEFLDKAVKLSPNDAQVHRAMGMVRFERKEYPLARKSFETVLKMEPGDVLAHYNMGILLKHYMKMPAEGDAHFRKVVQLGGSVDPEILKGAEQELVPEGGK